MGSQHNYKVLHQEERHFLHIRTPHCSPVNSAVQYGAGIGDKVPISALASEPRAHEGAHMPYYSTHPHISVMVWLGCPTCRLLMR